MMRCRLTIGVVTVALALAASGCCVDRSMVGGAASCGSVPGGEPYCGMGQCCAPDDFFCQGPLGYLRYMFTCGSGCGDYYVDEWVSDPPACADPCDHQGNWTGYSDCCSAPLLGCLSRLWGHRYDAGCEVGCAGGCAGGPAAGPMHDGMMGVEGEWLDGEPMMPMEELEPIEPRPAPPQTSMRAPRRLHPAQPTSMRQRRSAR